MGGVPEIYGTIILPVSLTVFIIVHDKVVVQCVDTEFQLYI